MKVVLTKRLSVYAEWMTLRRRTLQPPRSMKRADTRRLSQWGMCLTVLGIGLADKAMAGPGDNWRVVTQPGPVVQSYLRDYTEPNSVTSNPRPLTIGGNFLNARVHDVDFDTTGNLYAATTFFDNAVYKVNNTTGDMNQIATLGITTAEGDMAYDPLLNRLVIVNTFGSTSSAIEISLSNNNAVSTLWTLTGYDNLDGIAFDKNGDGFVLERRFNGNIAHIHKFSNSTLTSWGAINGGTLGVGPASGLDFNGSNQLHLLTNSGSLYHINPLINGGSTATFVDFVTNPDGHTYTGLAFAPAVPEPGAMALLVGIGIFGTALQVRRKRAVPR